MIALSILKNKKQINKNNSNQKHRYLPLNLPFFNNWIVIEIVIENELTNDFQAQKFPSHTSIVRKKK